MLKFFKKHVKNQGLKGSKNHDFSILPFGTYNFNFYNRRILPPPRTIWVFQGVSTISNAQTNALPQFIRSQHWIWWDSFFSNDVSGTCLNGGTKKF